MKHYVIMKQINAPVGLKQKDSSDILLLESCISNPMISLLSLGWIKKKKKKKMQFSNILTVK